MEVEKLMRLKFFLLVGVYLARFAEIGFCKPYSVASEGVNYNSNSRVKTHSTSSGKFVSETYFKKHDSLLDDSFDSYIANELPISLCGTVQDHLDIKLSVHKRLLIGEGSHRKLHSIIKINFQPYRIAEKFSHLWKLVIVERLPSGVFADPFEMQHLLDRSVFTDATVLGDTNLELPSIASNRSLVEVHVNINHGLLSGLNVLKIDIELPLHVRYPPLAERGFSRVEFGRPDLFLICNIEEKSQNNSCLLAQESDVESQTVVWEVPCGIKEHSEIVSAVTFVSAVASALFIVLTTLSYPRVGNT